MSLKTSTILSLMPVLFMLLLSAQGSEDAKGFSFADTPGDHLDVLLDGKIAARYMYAHDTSTPEKRIETFKPYLHVFDADGKAPITKGPGGLFPHHRAIFIGWNKVSFGGKSYDLWHMKGTDIVHQKFLEQKAGTDQATFTSLTHWIIETDKTIIEEERTMAFRRAPDTGRLQIDFISKLKAAAGDIELNGDPEHAGIHYRPAAEVVTKETKYVYPVENAEPHKDLDYPWVGETYTLGDKHYSVVELNHPGNPKKTKWSAYRDYGRFGAFPVSPVKSGETLTVKYRFLIADGEMFSIDTIQKNWDEFAGVTTPTPTPKVTQKPAEGSAPAKKDAPKKDPTK